MKDNSLQKTTSIEPLTTPPVVGLTVNDFSEPPKDETITNQETVYVNLESLDITELLRQPQDIKEETATIVAKWIIVIFGASLLCCFVLQIAIILLALKYPSEVKDTIIPAMGGSILEIVKLIGTLFSPLLAFILGYYFSISSKKNT